MQPFISWEREGKEEGEGRKRRRKKKIGVTGPQTLAKVNPTTNNFASEKPNVVFFFFFRFSEGNIRTSQSHESHKLSTMRPVELTSVPHLLQGGKYVRKRKERKASLHELHRVSDSHTREIL
eukprot:TRINITY_DN8810_c0_g1_i1.p1 TRINITY_DN8810_c0_g1~~TRINITY_DN8810_c0_g1_i1.p1  ORF type:complete len:122 (-),score=4.69 TRINITY_DN8810_c0_g1_i1:150-515(-)